MVSTRLSEIFVQTLEQAIDSVVVINADNNVVLFNAAAERLWALSRDQVLGRNVCVLIPQNIRPHHDSYINRNRASGIDKYVGVSRDVPIMRGDGSQRWGAMSISRIVSEDKILYTAFIKDITEQHKERERLRLLSLVTDQTDNAIMITDSQWRVVYVNPGFESMFGYTAQEVHGLFPDSLLTPHLSQEVREATRDLLSSGQPIKAEELTHMKSGERIWCSVTINPVCDSEGHITNAVGILTDISRSKMHEVLQHRMLSAMVREESLDSLMELACREIERIAPDVTTSVLQVDDQDRLQTLAAPRLPRDYCRQINGLKIGENVGSCGTAAFRGKPVAVSDIANDPLWAGFKDLALLHGLKSCWSTPIMSTQDRAIGTLALYYKDVRGPSAFHQRLIDVIVPLCALALEREKTRAHISQLAFYDSLTALPNRSLLQANAEHALSDARRNKTELAVLFIDLDRFKQVNDSMGHPAGDELLQIVAKRLCVERRQSDIVGRLSGDEFVMILPRCGSRHVTDVVEHLKLTLGEPCRIAGKTLSPSASIGISVFPEDGDDMGVLIHRADMAMYQAKKAGRGRFSFFSHDLNQKAQERQALEQALREALGSTQFCLHYQPQINMRDCSLYGVEALARWTHPQLGEISPVRFIPMAEECGLIGDLGLWAIREACRQLATWRCKGQVVPVISVNLSPTNFHNLELPGMISRTLEQFRLKASDLTLELTENVLMDIHPSTLSVLNEVHALGVGLAMDDFGTGYSSLSYLRRLPIQELKLDRSFVMDLENDPTSQALSDAVIHIGESLSLKVVAEGIETEAQYQILKRQGYHVAQGYLFARPLSAGDLEVWLSGRA